MTGSEDSKKRLPVLWKILRPLMIGYVALVVLAYWFQRRLMYFPDATSVPLPQEDQFQGLDEVDLRTSDGLRLRAWHWPGPRKITLLILHGNAGNRWHRLEWMKGLRSLGLGVFIVDYRGYGGSEGSPTEKGLYRDAEAAVDWLHAHGHTDLVYLGESIGTGVATELALRHPPAAVILQSGFTSAVDLAAKTHFFLPVRLMMKDRFENTKKLRGVTAPVLLIHGENDELIPPDSSRALLKAANEPKELFLVPSAGHNDLPYVGGRAYLDVIDRFIRKHAERS